MLGEDRTETHEGIARTLAFRSLIDTVDGSRSDKDI